jgi:hypothetical protein
MSSSVDLQLVCTGSNHVRVELNILPPYEEPTVQPYEEPALYSPVKRNAVSISLGSPVHDAGAMRDMFSFAGSIESFEVHDKQQAVVTYSDENAANTAMLLNDTLLAGSPVCVSAVMMDRAEPEVASPAPFYARPEADDQEDELLLFSPTKMVKASESELTYARSVLQTMADAGYTLGERALEFIAMVDAQYGPSLRQSASELSAAAHEKLAPAYEKLGQVSEQVRQLDEEHQISSQVKEAALEVAATAQKVGERTTEVASSVVSQVAENASFVAEGVSQVATQASHALLPLTSTLATALPPSPPSGHHHHQHRARFQHLRACAGARARCGARHLDGHLLVAARHRRLRLRDSARHRAQPRREGAGALAHAAQARRRRCRREGARYALPDTDSLTTRGRAAARSAVAPSPTSSAPAAVGAQCSRTSPSPRGSACSSRARRRSSRHRSPRCRSLAPRSRRRRR